MGHPEPWAIQYMAIGNEVLLYCLVLLVPVLLPGTDFQKQLVGTLSNFQTLEFKHKKSFSIQFKMM
jgi:hypothetical protein